MNDLHRLLRSASSPLLSRTAALSLLFAVGCGAEPSTGSSGQFDTELPPAACGSDEMDPLLACAAEPCAGMSGDVLSECIAESCPPAVFDVAEECAGCIVANLSSIDDVSHFCGGPQAPGDAACTAAEMDPLVACATEPCAGMSGDALSECFAESCPPAVFEVTEGCAGCIVANLASVEAIDHYCGG